MKHYLCKIATAPTVYTEDTVYQAWINTDIVSMFIRRMHLQLDSADSSGQPATSVYAFGRCRGTPTNGTTLTTIRFDNNEEPSKMLCLRNQGGLTMNGIYREDYFLERSILSKTTGAASNIDFGGAEGGLILRPGEGLILFADNTVIAGSGVYGTLEWAEE